MIIRLYDCLCVTMILIKENLIISQQLNLMYLLILLKSRCIAHILCNNGLIYEKLKLISFLLSTLIFNYGTVRPLQTQTQTKLRKFKHTTCFNLVFQMTQNQTLNTLKVKTAKALSGFNSINIQLADTFYRSIK